ncbi:hypothetical protein [Nocardia transvalensis]|uniref:hypothetical protein n=1 Tax=Nocardia transvalensis TaxID=37333 RepID=UPI0018962D66|nr:hypothetical protein [Nocardia transvalensis]MBF6332342.1 hypothetical protein [Nocardia transvalensis]
MTGDNTPQNPAIGNILFGGAIDAVSQKAVTQQRSARENDQRIGRSDVDPPYVTNPEPPPETMTHQQIYQAAQSIDREALGKLVHAWAQSSIGITSLFQLHRMGVNRALQGRWEGVSGEAAHQAAMRFAGGGEQMGQVAESAAFRLDAMHNAAIAFAAAVPPPPTPTAPNPDNPNESVLPNLTSGAKDRADNEASRAAYRMAVDAVNRIYLPICPPSGENVPAFVPPPQVGGGDGGPGVGDQGISSGGVGSGSGSTGGGAPGDSSQPGAQDPQQAQTTPADVDPASTAPSSASGNAPGMAGAGAPGQPGLGGASTSPAGVTAAGVGGPGGVGEGAGAGGRYPGFGGQGGSGAGSGRGGQGTSRPGVPGQGSTGAGPTAAAARAAGMGPGGPMGPMVPGAPGRRKEEDDERTKPVPDYLKQVQPELADLPPALTQAIGADYATWKAPDSNTPAQPTSTAATGSGADTPPPGDAGYRPPEPPRTGTGVPIRYDNPAQETGR